MVITRSYTNLVYTKSDQVSQTYTPTNTYFPEATHYPCLSTGSMEAQVPCFYLLNAWEF